MFPRRLKILLSISPALMLAACAVPTPVSVLSFAADGISFVATGRSVSDHALSVAADQDCAMFRLMKGEWMCRDFKPGEETELVLEARIWVAGPEMVGLVDPDGLDEDGILVAPPIKVAAAATPAAPTIEVAAVFEPETRAIAHAADTPVADTALTIRPATAAPQAASPRAVRPPVRAKRTFQGGIVVGSFGRSKNADALARRLADLNPTVIPVRIGQRLFHRVVVRPETAGEATRHRDRLRDMGITGLWVAPGCSANAGGFCETRIAAGTKNAG